MSPALVDRKDLAVDLGVSTATLDRMRKKGAIPYYQIGDRIKFDPQEVKEVLRGHQA